jgi:hypothetical protein
MMCKQWWRYKTRGVLVGGSLLVSGEITNQIHINRLPVSVLNSYDMLLSLDGEVVTKYGKQR